MSVYLAKYRIDPKELQVDAYSAKPQGSWSMHMVSGVRIKHWPTGLVAVSEAHRSQLRNKNVALDEIVWLLICREYNIPDGWGPMDTAPKDRPILTLNNHEAGPLTEDEGKTLTAYGTYSEMFGASNLGPIVAHWGGEDCEYDGMSGTLYQYPNWWFEDPDTWEAPLYPIAWKPIDGFTKKTDELCEGCGSIGFPASKRYPNRCDFCDNPGVD